FVLALSLTVVGCAEPGDEGLQPEGSQTVEQGQASLPETEVIPEAKPLWTDDTVKVGSGDFISMLLQEQGLTYSDSLALVAAAKDIHNLEKIRLGDSITFRRAEPGGAFLGLSYPLDRHNEERLVVVRDTEGNFVASRDKKTFVTEVVGRAGRIHSSLWDTVTAMKLGWNTAANMAAIFEWELDFNTQVREGDSFRVLVEELRDPGTGEVVRYGKILAAEYINSGTSFVGLRYENSRGEVGFFNAEGMSSKKMFLKSPLKFSRISSGFGRRFHPILKRWKSHNGTDYAAPRGTPVRAIGRGTIAFSGTKGGSGKHVRVKHTKKYGSSYSHLRRIAVRKGQSVRQGDIVGYVGSTGLATGPHLHFEFYVNGKYSNFAKQRFSRTLPIAPEEKAAFTATRDEILPKLRALELTEEGPGNLVLGDDDEEDADTGNQ
ncbi:MAG: peptidoglycan DD-metalloendopeptidase family protein, partial [Myxococcota bacterium]|nr:peptidoglycan DD-metalloendopeptidase family protein [Myxococcota bacterium]